MLGWIAAEAPKASRELDRGLSVQGNGRSGRGMRFLAQNCAPGGRRGAIPAGVAEDSPLFPRYSPLFGWHLKSQVGAPQVGGQQDFYFAGSSFVWFALA